MVVSEANEVHTYFWHVELVCPAFDAKVWVAFSDGQETGALFGVALGLATAPGKPFSTVAAALAELFTEILWLVDETSKSGHLRSNIFHFLAGPNKTAAAETPREYLEKLYHPFYIGLKWF